MYAGGRAAHCKEPRLDPQRRCAKRTKKASNSAAYLGCHTFGVALTSCLLSCQDHLTGFDYASADKDECLLLLTTTLRCSPYYKFKMQCKAIDWHESSHWPVQISSMPTCPADPKYPFWYTSQHRLEDTRDFQPVISMSQSTAAHNHPTESSGESSYASAQQTTTDQLRQFEDLLQRLQERSAALRRPQDISPRTPRTVSTHFNAADNIERQLRADGHTVWGFVVYRCAYGSDDDWAMVIRRLNEAIRSAMDTYNGHDMLESWRVTVFDDKERLDNANTQVVREHFREWSATAVKEEQGSREAIEARSGEPQPWFRTLALRYRFCIQVDEASLQSIVSEGEPAPIVSKSTLR